jgi:hypothetical protein
MLSDGKIGGSKAARWTGWGLTGLVGLFLVMDSSIKLLMAPQVVEAMRQIEYPIIYARGIGAMEVVILVLYLTPRTATLGAILMTGLLGGAVASHLRHSDPMFSHVLFGVYVGILAWGALYLRNGRLRALIPIQRPAQAL